MVHDHIASAVQLARARLSELDPRAPETTVATATYRMFLETLIELGGTPANQKLADTAARVVMGKVSETEAASNKEAERMKARARAY
jgi:hypothetical protein